ncbi:hypothetical protein [Allomuricauda sp. M10]|uniref:hypothetical protein n=1 Tax=Allomuricauda sp. M10 TaxID=2683292 RepID=UPI001D18B67A|nr:hypothetical protein [Muricauda sp. M10]
MEIHWRHLSAAKALDQVQRINLEYAVQLQVIRILINEAEHLMDYLSLIVLEIDCRNGQLSVHNDTPEPLYALVERNFVQVNAAQEEVEKEAFSDLQTSLLAIS